MSTPTEGKICAKKADAEEWLQEAVHLSLYYDFYGALLSERQRLIFEDYVDNDMSLSEIAGEYGMTRQGVYDTVKRCGAKLYEYEEKLHLAERFAATRDHAESVRSEALSLAETLAGTEPGERAARLAGLAEELLAKLQD